MANIIDCDNDKTTLNSNAGRKPSTRKPPTMAEQNKIIRALITNRNKPNVNMVIGSVKIKISGLINVFNKLKTKATIKAVVNPAI